MPAQGERQHPTTNTSQKKHYGDTRRPKIQKDINAICGHMW